jgi:DNA-binding CsgD family transcriptional regulator
MSEIRRRSVIRQMFASGGAIQAGSPIRHLPDRCGATFVNDHEGPNVRVVLTVLFILIAVGGVVDLWLDDPTTWRSPHVIFELTLTALSLVAALYLGLGWYRSQQSVSRLERLVEQRRAERDEWRQSAERLLEGLAAAIDQQFGRWGLTDAERETALGLIRGYSHKRIATVTGRAERTVRQHAVAVYRKSGLGGRAELAAFFLEGLPFPPGSKSVTGSPTESPL